MREKTTTYDLSHLRLDQEKCENFFSYDLQDKCERKKQLRPSIWPGQINARDHRQTSTTDLRFDQEKCDKRKNHLRPSIWPGKMREKNTPTTFNLTRKNTRKKKQQHIYDLRFDHEKRERNSLRPFDLADRGETKCGGRNKPNPHTHTWASTFDLAASKTAGKENNNYTIFDLTRKIDKLSRRARGKKRHF